MNQAPYLQPDSPPGFGRELAFTYAALLAAVLAVASGIVMTDFVASPWLFVTLGKLLLVLFCASMLATLGCARIADFFRYLAILAGISGALALLTTVLAASDRPYADPVLAELDGRLFGVTWDHVRVAALGHGQAMAWLSAAYRCLDIQPFLIVALLVTRRRVGELVRFVNAWTIALILSIALFCLVPAQGGYVANAVPIGSIPGLSVHVAWNDVHMLEAIRTGGFRLLDGQSFFGLVTFPSFHAAGAVLLGWGFRTTRGLRWVAGVVNAVMFVSAVPVGGHYLVDLFGGAAVALTAIALASGAVPQRARARAAWTVGATRPEPAG